MLTAALLTLRGRVHSQTWPLSAPGSSLSRGSRVTLSVMRPRWCRNVLRWDVMPSAGNLTSQSTAHPEHTRINSGTCHCIIFCC